MTTVRIEYTFAGSFLTRRQLKCRVLIPACLGSFTLLFTRYYLNAWPADQFASPSTAKWAVTSLLVLALGYLIWRAVFELRLLARKHFLSTFLKDRSAVHKLLSSTTFIRALSALAALTLAMVAYVVIQTYSLIDLAALFVGCSIGLLLAQGLGWLLTDSLAQNCADLFFAKCRRGVVLACAVIAVVVSTLAQDAAAKWSIMDEDEVVDRIKREVVHPVPNVQRAIRVLKYFDVTLLRIRDGMPFPYGWAIYLCLLVPQTFPLYAIVCIFLGWDPLTGSDKQT